MHNGQRTIAAPVVAIGVLLGTVSNADATVLTGPIENPANGHTYYLLEAAGWTQSEAEAVSLGGHLVTVNDADEHAFVELFGTLGGGDRHLWIGLNDAMSEGVFIWASGESSSYENWYPGEPNGFTPGEDYVYMERPGAPWGGQWLDAVSSPGYPVFAVVEVAPPCTTDIDGSGVVGFTDLLFVLSQWGPCAPLCVADVNGDGEVDFDDLLEVLSTWGPCS